MAEKKVTVIPPVDTDKVRKAVKGFTTNVRTHAAPQRVSNLQMHAPDEQQIQKAAASNEINEAHAKPEIKKAMGKGGNPLSLSDVAHYDDPHKGSTDPRLRERSAKAQSLVHGFVSTNKPAEKEAHRTAFHALTGGKPLRGASGICSTPGCKRTTEGTPSCPGGKCDVDPRSTNVGARPRE
jgi:hypothetical protein